MRQHLRTEFHIRDTRSSYVSSIHLIITYSFFMVIMDLLQDSAINGSRAYPRPLSTHPGVRDGSVVNGGIPGFNRATTAPVVPHHYHH